MSLALTPLALALLLGAGCSVGFFPSPITPGAPPAADPAVKRADFLPLARLRWMRGEEQAVLLTERGELVDQGTFIGTLRRDGTFTTRDGKRTLVMEPDGTINPGEGRQAVIAADGTATLRVHGQPDETVTPAQLAKPQGGAPGLTLEGGSAELARTATWILLIPDLLRISAGDSD